ncbi:transmembrane protein 70, mitochondrial [Centropristis striata]|uniref:transmembrane protein 70, mitochondrial n=1 Tax=Centropristis striata TaxID=184440 RepID=UPI0027E1804C|nr:transmembrane protein 70, mitochondrial [Centropristis striata]
MFSVGVLHRLRPCRVSQLFSNRHVTATRHVATLSACCVRTESARRLRAEGRSLLSLSNKVQSHLPFTRCLFGATNSEDGNLIYTGNLGRTVRTVKMFSYGTSAVSIVLVPQIFLKSELVAQSLIATASMYGVIAFFTFLTPVLLHYLTKVYVLRLYHNPDTDTYTAITCNIVLAEKKTVFHQRQVKVPAVSQMFTTFYADKKGLLVNPDLFLLPQDYNHLMGYDKPFSFDIDDVEKSEKN